MGSSEIFQVADSFRWVRSDFQRTKH